MKFYGKCIKIRRLRVKQGEQITHLHAKRNAKKQREEKKNVKNNLGSEGNPGLQTCAVKAAARETLMHADVF